MFPADPKFVVKNTEKTSLRDFRTLRHRDRQHLLRNTTSMSEDIPDEDSAASEQSAQESQTTRLDRLIRDDTVDLRRFIRSRVRGVLDSDLEDLIQESHARFLKDPAKPIQNAGAYLVGIAERVAKEFLRSKKRSGRIESVDATTATPTTEVSDPNRTPEELTARHQADAQIAAAVKRLKPPLKRHFCLLHWAYGYSVSEAARMCDISEHKAERWVTEIRIELTDYFSGKERDFL
jgi:RNA polymerase sigma factor (sigma-70 family)